ncbi:MAG: hypothetical protein ACP5OA_02305 [Candidatus Woesearchaeota archaeon]
MKLYRNIKLLVLVSVIVSFIAIVVIFDESSDNISGEVVNTRVEVIPAVYTNCSFELYPGWNMVSFYCLGLFVSRNAALQSINGSYDSIFEYTANDANEDPWKSYNPNLPSWVIQQVAYMDRLSGYWIYTDLGANFSYNGIYSDSTIYLYNGWNFVGYPHIEAYNITQRLDNVSFSIVKNYMKNLSGDVWLVHINGSMSNNLTQFETYKGYWINVSGDQAWLVIK